jgi:hypothetical protein
MANGLPYKDKPSLTARLQTHSCLLEPAADLVNKAWQGR